MRSCGHCEKGSRLAHKMPLHHWQVTSSIISCYCSLLLQIYNIYCIGQGRVSGCWENANIMVLVGCLVIGKRLFGYSCIFYILYQGFSNFNYFGVLQELDQEKYDKITLKLLMNNDIYALFTA